MHAQLTSPFPQGEQLQSPHFSGRVWLKMLVNDTTPYNCPIGHVTFEPGCRNSWHKHAGGQILLVTGGMGYYQQRGTPAQLLRPGETVAIPANVEHWHGATPHAWFSHLAITTNPEKGPAQWLEPVSQKDYDAATAHTAPASAALRLSETARATLSTLFPAYAAPLAATDPELMEIFNNFAYDEVWQHGTLDTRTRLMVILAACIAAQGTGQYAVMLEAALNAGVSPVEIKEVLYQAVPYAGMVKVYDFVALTNATLAARGVSLPLPPQATTTAQDRFHKGLAVQKSIFGPVIDALHTDSPASQRHIQQYLSDNCFGDFLTRGGLDVKTRELLTLSMLLSLGGSESQLKAHMQGNAAVGNAKETQLAVLTQLLPYVGYPRSLNALRCLNEVFPETAR